MDLLKDADPLPITLLTGFGSGRRCAASRRLRRHEPPPKPAAATLQKPPQW